MKTFQKYLDEDFRAEHTAAATAKRISQHGSVQHPLTGSEQKTTHSVLVKDGFKHTGSEVVHKAKGYNVVKHTYEHPEKKKVETHEYQATAEHSDWRAKQKENSQKYRESKKAA